MEGFYYDAEIGHITEIVKNILYFGVLEGESNKILKNTNDIYYFNIDNELVYLNYYFDFGPLNLSCLYKYCCKLNNCLQYVNGSKRVVHYTTSNPLKRVNAAYLMGCYTIIYLNMNPKDIYKILLNTGGPFKQYVDASQGFSHYTISMLDCLNAVQKALSFNFFNFGDFSVLEYDTYDKLQNGDMNWLLPRKFLAFIGPTDNMMLNGHSPNYYIKYFLQSDIKTVIRLNNKLYDPSVFANAGIEHHELFFPDGTIPTKQILLHFLHLSENARAAIAVHCKAGLGRTGSLIGAYIIKHYHMTAREAISWMRICRPGSVIGQQQGWLEKIEGWLWRQGYDYRFQHYGDGDRIPHHKYGVYSKIWPNERDKLIRHVQKRRLEALQCNTLNAKLFENNFQNTNFSNSGKCNVTSKPSVLKNRLKNQMCEEGRKMPKANIHENKFIGKPMDSKYTDVYYTKDILHTTVPPKRLFNNPKYKEKFYDLSQVNNLQDVPLKSDQKFYQGKLKKRNQSESRGNARENDVTPRTQKNFAHNLEHTQGDKLNEIKAKRLTECLQRENKQLKSAPTTSKKGLMDNTMLPPNRPHLHHLINRGH